MNEIIKDIDSLFVDGLLNALITVIIGTFIVLIVNKLLSRFIEKKWPGNNRTQMRMKKTFLIFVYLFFVLSEIKAMSSIATALLASGGILAVVIGLASQEAASNLINGIMVISYKPFKVGDFVIVRQYDVSGYVYDISLRHSVIETLEKTQVIVPNTIMNKAIIENVSNIEHTKANHLFVDISYESDIDKAIEVIQKLADQHPLVIDSRSKTDKKKGTPKVPVHVVDFKDSGIALRATINTKDNITGFNMLSDLRKQIIKEFDQEGIVIPYPHITIDKNSTLK